MRIILVVFSIVLFLLLFFPVYLVLLLVGRFRPRAKAKASQAIVRNAFRFVLASGGIRYKAIGIENVPKEEAVLYAGNHRGLADIPVGYITVPTLTGFVAKKEMQHIPFFSWWMRNMNCLFLDRENMKEGLKTILKGIDNIKAGYSMFIMPEGTRGHGADETDMLPFKEGSLKMSEKTGCPIIPVAITGSSAVFEDHVPWVKPGLITIHYGEPIYPNDLDKETRKRLGMLVQERILSMLKEDMEKYQKK